MIKMLIITYSINHYLYKDERKYEENFRNFSFLQRVSLTFLTFR